MNGINTLAIPGFGYLRSTEKKPDVNAVKLALREEKLEEEEIVSTVYQNIPKERVTGSFTIVDNKLLDGPVSLDLMSRLRGGLMDY